MKEGKKERAEAMNKAESEFYARNESENLSFSPGQQATGFFNISGNKYPFYLKAAGVASSSSLEPYLQVKARLPREIKWNDRLIGQLKDSGSILKLRVIFPDARELKKQKEEKLAAKLEKFSGSVGQMLLALTEEKGVRGLRQEELQAFCRMSESALRELAMELEKEGQLYILNFSPLFLLSSKSLDFLNEKILGYIKNYNQKRPQEIGLPIKKIKDRFSLPQKILLLALNCLVKDQKIILKDDLVSVPGFETRLSAEEDQVVTAIEKLFRENRFSSFSLEELAKKFNVHPARLNTMLELLLQKNKIVQSREGFLLHSDWLEEIKKQLIELKKRGKAELTVGDFKKMTGLTRKYAIPLLEFLDELGLTKRIGPKRIIL